MAVLKGDPANGWWVCAEDLKGEVHTFPMGRCSITHAENCRRAVVAMVNASESGEPMDSFLLDWLESQPDDVRAALLSGFPCEGRRR